MRLLDAILPAPAESRYSFSQWMNDALVFGGRKYGLGYAPTWGDQKADPINDEFGGYIDGALKANPVISAIEQTRFSVFAEARFLFQRFVQGRPGDLFGTPELQILERPWPGGVTGDLLARMLLHADLAGNAYVMRVRDELVLLRPDWVEIVLAERISPSGDVLGFEKQGYHYYQGGKTLGSAPVVLLRDEVGHFAPYPDPAASYRGMSWMTPVLREIQADKQATDQKLKFFENSSTPNLAVKWTDTPAQEEFERRIDMAERRNSGVDNAYKTMYLAGGADVTAIGTDLKQMDFKSVQGGGETRMAAAAGVHPVIVGLSEGMQGSSLNAGNYQAAKRVFVDKTMRPLWRNASGTLEAIVAPPQGTRLWYDDRDIPFLREDIQDRANVQQTIANTARTLVDAGYTPDSVISAVQNEDMSLLVHSGLFSVQLQEAGAPDTSPEPARSEPMLVVNDGAFRFEPKTEMRIEDGAIRTEFPLDLSEQASQSVETFKDSVTESIRAEARAEVDAVREAAERETEQMRAQVEADLAAEREMLDAAKAELAEVRGAPQVKELEYDADGLIAAVVVNGRRSVVEYDREGRMTRLVEETA